MLTLRKGIRCQNEGSVARWGGRQYTALCLIDPLHLVSQVYRLQLSFCCRKQRRFLPSALTNAAEEVTKAFCSPKISHKFWISRNPTRHWTCHNKQILVGPRGWPLLLPLPVHTIQGPYQMPHWAVNVYPSRGDTLHNEQTGCGEHYREHTTTSALHWNKLISHSVLLLITVRRYF